MQVNDYDVVPVVLSVLVVLSAAAVAAVSSSFLAQEPISATMPMIKTIQNSNFYIITSFIIDYRKMQDYSYIFISGMVLTNTGITPSSHNLKQLKNASGQFPVHHIPIIIRMQHLFFRILSVSFCLCKICNNRIFTPDKQSQNSQHRALKNLRNKIEVQAFFS